MRVFIMTALLSSFLVTESTTDKVKIGSNDSTSEKASAGRVEVIPDYCDEGEDEDPQPMITGMVYDNSTSNPIYHACVELRTTGGSFVGMIGTDVNGHYYFNSVPNGYYNLTVARAGYTTQIVPITVSGSPQTVNVPLN